MEILLEILPWIGVGAAIAIGFCVVIFIVVKLISLYEKLFPSKSEIERQMENAQINYENNENILIIPEKYFDQVGKTIKSLREELWEKDVVLPTVLITPVAIPDYNFVIKIEGQEIFKGNLTGSKSPEEVVEFISLKIKSGLESIEKIEDGDNEIEK